MKKFLKGKKTFILALALIVAVLGTGFTIAYMTDKDSITNTVKSIARPDDTTDIEEETGGYDENGYLQKTVTVKNTDEAYSEDGDYDTAFIRARITVSPDLWESREISLYTGNWSGNSFTGSEEVLKTDGKNINGWVYASSDGWWYYTEPVVQGKSTKSLLDAVYSKNPDETADFDVTIYEESVLSTYGDDYMSAASDDGVYDKFKKLTDSQKVDIIQKAFEAADSEK